MTSRKVIIITGASRGIGHAIASHLLRPLQNCDIVVVARSQQALSELEQTDKEHCATLAGDLGDMSLGKKAVDLALEKWGRVDGIVVNHGMLEPVEKIADAEPEEWKRAFDVNVLSAVALIKAALPSLRETKGRIILTSSGAAVKGTSAWGSYSMGKAALNSLARTLGEEEPDIVTVAIRPGVVNTQMQTDLANLHNKKMEPKDMDRFTTMRAEGKMLRPEQPGNVMARLVLDAPKTLSGQFFNWDDNAALKDFQDM